MALTGIALLRRFQGVVMEKKNIWIIFLSSAMQTVLMCRLIQVFPFLHMQKQTLLANSADDKCAIFFFYFPRKRLDIPWKWLVFSVFCSLLANSATTERWFFSDLPPENRFWQFMQGVSFARNVKPYFLWKTKRKKKKNQKVIFWDFYSACYNVRWPK